jgi:RecB family exonuclease
MPTDLELASSSSRLLTSLARATAATPTTRKRLVAPDVNFARELLVALAQRTGGWIGWEATSLRDIADELAFVPLARLGRRIAGDIEVAALINESLRRCIDAGTLQRNFTQLANSLGFRRAVRDSLLELRTGGVSGAELAAVCTPKSAAHDLATVLTTYEELLRDRDVADPASVFEAAITFFDEQAPFTLDGALWIVPTTTMRGLPAQLALKLRTAGACELELDARYDEPVLNVSGATIDIFAGATPSEEIREVFRRIVAEGLRFDDVEIAATDPDTYGVALDVLSGQLDIGVTMLAGVPLARTRLGRAIERWMLWLSDGLPADVLRQALEAGELGAIDALDLPASALADQLRRLRIGWGRARYDNAILQLEAEEHEPRVRRHEDEDDAEFARRVESRRRKARNLRVLLNALLAATPDVPERGADATVHTTTAALAAATLARLALYPVHGDAEAQTVARLSARLSQLAEVREPETTFANAMAALQDALSDLRAWPQRTEERKPWSSAGGIVHLTDIVHAGTTGRRRVFVVGLDAERTSGAGLQDPLLPDGVRQSLGAERLATSAERRREREARAIVALSGLRGRVTLSFATSSNLDGRESGPSALLLQAWRAARGDQTLSYERLREHVRPPAAAVPERDGDGSLAGRALLDRRDVWLDAINDGALLRDGTDLVREGHEMLDAGLLAIDARDDSEVNAYHGIVSEAAGKLDPSTQPDRIISPSSLELLAKCPLAWFYRHGLSLYVPDDPEYDRERWLNALHRGSLLHEVYERFTREYKDRQTEIQSTEAMRDMLRIADERIDAWRVAEPPPSESVFEGEANALRQAALTFLSMEQQRARDGDAGRWRDFEVKFGGDAATATYEITPGRVIAVKGIIDRVDELPDGGLRVVDYKTGGNYQFRKNPKAGPFNGGRQLQPAIYASVSTSVLGGTVTSFEYRFPTEKGGGEVIAYDRAELADAREIIASLLDQVQRGEFIPTDDKSDCSYCDYRPICRVDRGEHATSSPRADWAAEHGPELPVYQVMRRLRGKAAEPEASNG